MNNDLSISIKKLGNIMKNFENISEAIKFEKDLLSWYNKHFKVYYNIKIKDKFRYHSKRMG